MDKVDKAMIVSARINQRFTKVRARLKLAAAVAPGTIGMSLKKSLPRQEMNKQVLGCVEKGIAASRRYRENQRGQIHTLRQQVSMKLAEAQ